MSVAGYLMRELTRVDEWVRQCDTPALEYRLKRNAEEQESFLATLPATRDWLAYEQAAITEELARRGGDGA